MNYVFYDFETSGTNRYFDQPLQIAAICVDETFEINSEFTLNETCKLKDGVVPHPQALIVNKIEIDTLKNGQSFYDMIDKVQKKFTEWSPAIFIGYNSLFFDEVVLRQSLYQSLHDPYLTNTNNNRRADLYHIFLGLSKLRPDIIKLGINPETEKESFKLEYLAKANKIEQEKAHDALSDVIATIGLAKLIKEKASDYWDHCMHISNPENFRAYLAKQDLFFKAPSHPSHVITPIKFLSENPERNKELSFFDLKFDPENYIDKKSVEIMSLIESKEKVIKLIEINKSPIILGEEFISHEIFEDNEIKDFKSRIKSLKNHELFLDRLKQALVDRSQDREVNFPMPEWVETQIYAAFANAKDKEKMKTFRNTTDPEEKNKLAKDFEDQRYRELAYRILFNESRNFLDEDKVTDRELFFAERALGTDQGVKWCTISKAKKDIDNLRENSQYSDYLDYIDQIKNFIDEEEIKYKKYQKS